jgi:hypothetical protein
MAGEFPLGVLVIRARLAATLLGVVLATGAVGSIAYWRLSFAHGEESCIKCGAQRIADRRLCFWRHSTPSLPERPAAASPGVCLEHEWERVGCWEIASGFARYGAPHAR